jgi:glycerophosphoryl diester phosphodiesterase
MRRTALGLFLLAVVAHGTAAEPPWDRPETIHEFMTLGDRTRVIAHRGFSARAPENTLLAVAAAIRVGADMVEVDVTLTSDARIVCIHDDTLDRTTNGFGPVQSRTLAELKRLDAGSWFSREFHNARIPTLDEVLDLVAGRVLLDIEIKPEAVTRKVTGGISERVVALVRNHGLADQVVISSFEPLALQQVAAVDPSIVTASLFNEDLHRGSDPLDIVAEARSRGLTLSRKQIGPDLVRLCHGNAIPVGVYTVNKARAMRRMIDLGVHAIFTDHPDRMIRIMVERGLENLIDEKYPPVEDIAEWPKTTRPER